MSPVRAESRQTEILESPRRRVQDTLSCFGCSRTRTRRTWKTFYLNLVDLDWSSTNVLGVGLGDTLGHMHACMYVYGRCSNLKVRACVRVVTISCTWSHSLSSSSQGLVTRPSPISRSSVNDCLAGDLSLIDEIESKKVRNHSLLTSCILV